MERHSFVQGVVGLVLLAGWLVGCGGPQAMPTELPATATSAPPMATPASAPPMHTPIPATPTEEAVVTTQIVIDGRADDWENYEVVDTDPEGDAARGSPDIAEIRAFNNDEYLYLLITQYKDGDADWYHMLIDVDPGRRWGIDYEVHVWPESNRVDLSPRPVEQMLPLGGATAAQDEVIEMKMPLTALDGQPVRGFTVSVYLGGDRWGDATMVVEPAVLDELEPVLAETQIVVDGSGEDWADYEVLGTDPVGDQVPGTPDLAEIRAFSNDQYFYVLITQHEDGDTDHYDIMMDVDTGDFDYQLSVWPERNEAVFAAFPVVGDMLPLEGVTAAQDEVIEVKMPLSAVGDQPVRSLRVHAYLGDRVGDEVDRKRAVVVNETEPASVVAVPTATRQPGGSEARTPVGVIRAAGYAVEFIHRAALAPWAVRVGPGGQILITQERTGQIWQVGDRGQVSVYRSFPGFEVRDFGFDPSGRLWFSTMDRAIWRVGDDGSPALVARGAAWNFDFDSKGNVYAVDVNAPEQQIRRVTPDGEVSVVARGFGRLRTVEIGPNDEVLVVDETTGELIQVFQDGRERVVAAGFGVDYTPRFAPDGMLYVLHWSGLQTVDLETGTKTQLSWYDKYKHTGCDATFDSAGRMLTFHPNHPVYRLDLQAQTSEMIFHPRGNTPAMGVGQGSQVYVAYGNQLADGETVVYRIGDEDRLVEISRVPYGEATAMAFGLDGIAFLGVSDRAKGSMIYTLDPLTGAVGEYARVDFWPISLAVHPLTALPWAAGGDGVYYLDDAGQSHAVPTPDGSGDAFLSFGPDGTLYAMLWFQASGPLAPERHGIYRREADGTWVELVDMTAEDTAIALATVAVCSDGTVYTVASIDGPDIEPGRVWPSMNAILRLEEDHTLTLLAYDLSSDGFDAECDPRTGDIVFTGIDGVLRFYRE